MAYAGGGKGREEKFGIKEQRARKGVVGSGGLGLGLEGYGPGSERGSNSLGLSVSEIFSTNLSRDRKRFHCHGRRLNIGRGSA